MNPTHLMPLTGTVTTHVTDAANVDQMGDPLTVETEHSFKCWWQQDTREESDQLTDVQRERLRLFLEPAAAGVVDGSAEITIDGIGYVFDGPPWPARNPRTNVVTHVEADVRRST